MSNQSNDIPFNTPNPSELKKAVKEDPVFDKDDQEGDVIVEHPAKDGVHAEELGRENAADLGNSQTTIANLGGH
ncbi:hypothetical protein JOY44_14145 [Phormidium sp. CLA17]|uniref:hypothetical protein n=1 Tax=Leptolyngbya sp. Cla-17 TaxID=2803751 RepID=UPI001490FEF8|nr:hypothetical protein [Leptolyngbya sp. Cla-17]MBM0742733.1 hypothetical protein [Leptolyngbya sp. Cla-17]